jgi:hypothetical protein
VFLPFVFSAVSVLNTELKTKMDIGFEFVVTPKGNDKISEESNGQVDNGERKSDMTYSIQILSDNVDNWQV